MSFMRTPDERLRGRLIIPWQVWGCQKPRGQERLLTAVNFQLTAVSRGSYLPRLHDPLKSRASPGSVCIDFLRCDVQLSQPGVEQPVVPGQLILGLLTVEGFLAGALGLLPGPSRGRVDGWILGSVRWQILGLQGWFRAL